MEYTQLKANADGQGLALGGSGSAITTEDGAVLETEEGVEFITSFGNTLQLVSGQESIVQTVQRRCLTVRGGWRYDLTQGVPYFERVLGKPINIEGIRSIFRQVILETPGVLEVLALDLEVVGRTLLITTEVRARVGSTVLSAPVRIETERELE